jgi:hypothetical protein
MRTLFGSLSLYKSVLSWRSLCDVCTAADRRRRPVYHVHGWGSPLPDRQHRVNHCRGNSDEDYYIALDGVYTELLAEYAKTRAAG